MPLSTILIVVLLIVLLASLPAWPYSRSWGYAPGGILTTLLIVVVVLALLGHV